MARTNYNLTDEEVKERVFQVADYIISTGSSTRKTAKYFTEHYFAISNATVHEYLHKRLPKLDAERYQKVMKIIELNTPKTIEDAETKIRIYQAASLILQDYSIDEIVEALHSTYDIIYDDLTSRLPKLDVKIAEDVKKKLLEHRLQNLPQYKDNIPASFFTPKGNSKK